MSEEGWMLIAFGAGWIISPFVMWLGIYIYDQRQTRKDHRK